MFDLDDLQETELNDSGSQTELSSTAKYDIYLTIPLAKYKGLQTCM